MIKNKTLRGLALGAISTLVATGLVTSPAQAAGIEGFVSLAPSTGTEYSVLAGTNNTFTLTANEASTLNTGDLKFMVTDASGVIEPGLNTDARIGFTFNIGSTASQTATLFKIATSQSGAVGSYVGSTAAIEAGSLVAFKSAVLSEAGNTVLRATGSYVVDATSAMGSSAGDARLVVTAATATLGATNSDTVSATVLREKRNTTLNTYVVDTGSNDSTTGSTLELVTPDTTSRTVTVVAWKDSNDDNKIDATEYVSATRTINFLAPSAVTFATTMTVVAADTTLSAVVTSTPVLNGNQVLTNDAAGINVAFTRQGDSTVVYAKGDGTTPATWNDTTKQFTLAVNLDADSGTIGWSTWNGTAEGWDVIAGANDNATSSISAITTTSKTVTFTKAGDPHNLRVGDKVTFANANADIDGVTLSVTVVPASNSFTVATATVSTTVGTLAPLTYEVTTYGASAGQQSLADRALPGTYTAQAYVFGAAAGAKATVAATSATSADVQFSTVQSATVQGQADGTAALVKKGTLTVPVEILVEDADEAAVTAGRPVVVTFTTSVLNAKVNDKTVAQTLTTDANGKVALTVTSPAGAVGSVTISATAENGPSQTFTLNWVAQAYGLVDLAGTAASLANSTRAVVAGGSYTLDLGVMDQWFAVAPSADYRLVVTGSGVVEGVKTLTDGKVSLTITDNGFATAMATTITLQKLTSAVWAPVAGKAVVMTTNINKNTNSVILGADGSSLYGGTADLSSPVSVKALVAQDRRLTTVAQPAYSESAEIFGKVQNAATSIGVEGAEVTITGPSSILFGNGSVDKVGSITVLSDASGNFGVTLYSTTAQKDTVITVTSLGKSATTKVTFTGTTTGGVGTTLVITAPDTVAPASTLQVKAKLTDTFGNAVASAPVRVTYTGPGIAFGALPTAVDALGELSFSVLLGGGDTGTITVVVSYDQNGDGDYVDAKDLNTTKTITVGAAAVAAPSADQKVNAGSFKGFVAVYAKGYKGQRLSAKIGNDWVIVNSLASDFVRVTDFTGAGVAITVKIYIDRVEVASIPLTTK